MMALVLAQQSGDKYAGAWQRILTSPHLSLGAMYHWVMLLSWINCGTILATSNGGEGNETQRIDSRYDPT